MVISELLLSVASSNLVGRKSKWNFIIKFSLLLSVILSRREGQMPAKQHENEFVASFLRNDYPEKRIPAKLLCC